MSQANPELRDDPLAEATEVPRTTVPSQDMPPEAAEKMATNYNMKSPGDKSLLLLEISINQNISALNVAFDYSTSCEKNFTRSC